MKCRDCDKLEPRGCGKTCCEVDGIVVRDFDDECKFTEDFINKYEQAKTTPIITISHAHLLSNGI